MSNINLELLKIAEHFDLDGDGNISDKELKAAQAYLDAGGTLAQLEAKNANTTVVNSSLKASAEGNLATDAAAIKANHDGKLAEAELYERTKQEDKREFSDKEIQIKNDSMILDRRGLALEKECAKQRREEELAEIKHQQEIAKMTAPPKEKPPMHPAAVAAIVTGVVAVFWILYKAWIWTCEVVSSIWEWLTNLF